VPAWLDAGSGWERHSSGWEFRAGGFFLVGPDFLCRVQGAMEVRAFAIGLVTCLGCAAKPPPAAAPTAPLAPAPAVAAEAPPDLSPVAAPEDLVLVGRLSRPRLLVETLANWAGMPIRLQELLPHELRGVDAVLAWDAPVEIAAVLDRHSTAKVAPPLVVLSIGLNSLPRALTLAREHGASPTRVAPLGRSTSTCVVTSNVRQPDDMSSASARPRIGRARVADAAAAVRRKARRFMTGLL